MINFTILLINFLLQERSKQERSNLDIVWQLETKTKEIQTLTARIQKVCGVIFAVVHTMYIVFACIFL